MRIEVKRITDPDLFREVAEMTTGKECRMSWKRAIASEHSIIRAEKYLVSLYGIPQFVMGHLVRHVHAQPFVRSKRTDRGGEDFSSVCQSIVGAVQQLRIELENVETVDRNVNGLIGLANDLPGRFDRMAPTDLALLLNAQEFINISKVRLCLKASKETREVWRAVIAELDKVDSELAWFCVPTCIYRGGICPEPKSCGFNRTELFRKQLDKYKLLFVG